MSKAKVEISFAIDLDRYAEFYGEEVNDETAQDALVELGAMLRRSFQGEAGAMRSSWYRAIAGRPTPVPDEEPGDARRGVVRLAGTL